MFTRVYTTLREKTSGTYLRFQGGLVKPVENYFASLVYLHTWLYALQYHAYLPFEQRIYHGNLPCVTKTFTLLFWAI